MDQNNLNSALCMGYKRIYTKKMKSWIIWIINYYILFYILIRKNKRENKEQEQLYIIMIHIYHHDANFYSINLQPLKGAEKKRS